LSVYLFSHVQKPEAEELERRAKENDAFAAEVAEVTLLLFSFYITAAVLFLFPFDITAAYLKSLKVSGFSTRALAKNHTWPRRSHSLHTVPPVTPPL
jgi:hypothetical protein